MEDTERIYRLTGGVRHYGWGESVADGLKPFIADFLQVEAGDEPWAELWLGAHPSLPSKLTREEGGEVPFGEAIAAAPQAWLGKNAAAANGGALPFLLKVLSCSHPLSIQSHPNAQVAPRLHQEAPQLYPDANDKTEIIIAVTPFQAMAGWRPFEEITAALNGNSAFKPWLEQVCHDGAAATDLRAIVGALFALPADVVQQILTAQSQAVAESTADDHRLFLHLLKNYPGDRGALFAYLLNHVSLQPGQALFLEPDTPHAYLQGTGIECMTNSDNVIRAGLTPKAVDVPTLMATVDFQRFGAGWLAPQELSKGVLRYAPPTPKFRLTFYRDAAIDLAQQDETVALVVVLDGAAKVTCADGTSYTVRRGESLARPAAACKGTIAPLEAGTVLVWADTVF